MEPGELELLGASINLGDLFTVIGIVAIVNIINFSDGVDGLAAGVCLIAALCLAAVALSLQRYEAGVLAGITAGAALGFLRHGFPPASSFMGDTGSNLLGYMLAVVAIQGSLKTNAVLALALPLIVLAVPILDTSFVIAKRLKHRQPIYKADRWHFHHRMANIGLLSAPDARLPVRLDADRSPAWRWRSGSSPTATTSGNFDLGWTIVMALFILAALAASVYVVFVLEILKLRHLRLWQRLGGQRRRRRRRPSRPRSRRGSSASSRRAAMRRSTPRPVRCRRSTPTPARWSRSGRAVREPATDPP